MITSRHATAMPTWNRPLTAASSATVRLRQERGQALVEFAVVLPVLMLVILGILYFGRYESYSSQMTQLGEQGARDAAVDFSIPSGASANGSSCASTTTGSSPNNGNLACYIASQATGELAAGNGSTVQAVSVWVDCDSNVTGSTCTSGNNTVTVCLKAQVAFPGLQVGVGTISQQATMRVEQSGAQDSAFVESSSNTPTATLGSLPANSPC